MSLDILWALSILQSNLKDSGRFYSAIYAPPSTQPAFIFNQLKMSSTVKFKSISSKTGARSRS
jgi:hypothetical protein